MVVGWLELVVMGFVDVRELALMTLMVVVAALHMLFQEYLTYLLHRMILLILKTLTLTNCFMKMKDQIDFQCKSRPRLIVCNCFFPTKYSNRL